MDYLSIITMILVIFGLITFFAIGTYLNTKTPLPEGCELPSLKCEHCSSTSCSYAKPNRVTEIKKEIKKTLENNNSGEVC